MAALEGVKVGDTVLMVEDRREPQEFEVVRVGRTIVYVMQYGREVGFRKDTGLDAKHYAGAGTYLYTKEAWADRQIRAEQRQRLRELGFEARFGGQAASYSAAAIAAVIEVLERDSAEGGTQ